MTKQIENLKRLLAKLRELNNLDKLTERVDKTMRGLHDQKISLLRQIEEKFVHYNNFRNLRQEESEERKLLRVLENIVLREKQYIEFLIKILDRFKKDFGEIRKSLHGAYYTPDIVYDTPQDPATQFMRSIQNLLSYNLFPILYSTKERIEKELSFMSKWVGGTGPLSFFRQKSVLNNFKKELEGLYALYRENEEYVRSQLQKIPTLQRDIQIKTTDWIAHIRRERAYEKRPREREEYLRVVSSLGRESNNFGKDLAKGVAYGLLGVAAGVTIGQAIKRF